MRIFADEFTRVYQQDFGGPSRRLAGRYASVNPRKCLELVISGMLGYENAPRELA